MKWRFMCLVMEINMILMISEIKENYKRKSRKMFKVCKNRYIDE